MKTTIYVSKHKRTPQTFFLMSFFNLLDQSEVRDLPGMYMVSYTLQIQIIRLKKLVNCYSKR